MHFTPHAAVWFLPHYAWLHLVVPTLHTPHRYRCTVGCGFTPRIHTTALPHRAPHGTAAHTFAPVTPLLPLPHTHSSAVVLHLHVSLPHGLPGYTACRLRFRLLHTVHLLPLRYRYLRWTLLILGWFPAVYGFYTFCLVCDLPFAVTPHRYTVPLPPHTGYACHTAGWITLVLAALYTTTTRRAPYRCAHTCGWTVAVTLVLVCLQLPRLHTTYLLRFPVLRLYTTHHTTAHTRLPVHTTRSPLPVHLHLYFTTYPDRFVYGLHLPLHTHTATRYAGLYAVALPTHAHRLRFLFTTLRFGSFAIRLRFPVTFTVLPRFVYLRYRSRLRTTTTLGSGYTRLRYRFAHTLRGYTRIHTPHQFFTSTLPHCR